MIQQELHQQLLSRSDLICNWYKDQLSKLAFPIYSSYDIRDSGYKIANVDANIYPAGFNNICPADKESAVQLFENYIFKHYGSKVKKILIVTEEHTHNAYYWENAWTIQNLIQSAGFEVRLAFASPLTSALTLQSATGKTVYVESASADSSLWKEFKPDLVISNNDFSEAHEEWARQMTLPMNPPREMGWYQRKKSRYFKFYNMLANQFCEVAGIDPFAIRVETEEFNQFDIGSDISRTILAERVDHFLAKLKSEYQKRGLSQEPFCFVKNNSGTYGLAVIKVNRGQDVKEWSYKSRKKMKAAKGGRDVEEVIIQEGIPSIVQSDGATAEPVIYMVGSELAGGFLRTHSEKSSTESLNSPGAIYKRLCVSDLSVRPQGCCLENVYGWSAKLGLLAIAKEAEEMSVVFKNFKS